MSLKVGTEELVTHAGELYGCAYTFDGMRYHLWRVGGIPITAWGQMPWSQRWREAWAQAIDHRITEADTIRDQAGEASGRILTAAANYAGTDLQVAAIINSTNPDTSPYARADAAGAGPLSAHPGQASPAPTFALHHVTPQLPGDNQRWQHLQNERFPRVVTGMGTDINQHTISTIDFVTVENDGLDDFVREHYATLAGADEVMQEYAPGSKRPFADVIMPAWLSVPSILDNRSQLVGSVGNTYTEMQTNLSSAITTLQRAWEGSGANAYQDYAKSFLGYLGQIAGQVTWLGSEGQKTARLMRDLRNSYAQLGAKHIKRVADAHQKYVDTISSALGRVTECSSPAGAAKALIGEVQSMTQEMTSEEDAAMDQALDILSIEAKAIAGSPNFTDPVHDAVPFPHNALDTSGWGSGWNHKAGQP